MTGKIMPLRERDTSTIQAAADAFVSSPRYANPNTRRGDTGVLDRLLAGLGASRPLAEVSGEELAGLLEQLWGQRAPATWNRNRGAVTAWLSWCAANRLPAPVLPASAERRLNATRAAPRPAIDRALSRRDVPLREKTLWRMLYETAARASEVLALNIEDPRPGRPPRPGPLQGRRHRMDLLGLRHRAPAAPPHPRPPGRAGVLVRAPPRPRPPPRCQGPVPCYRTGPARLRPRPDLVHPVHRVGVAPAPPFRGHPSRRARYPAAADHGQDPAPQSAHRDAVRPPRRRSRR